MRLARMRSRSFPRQEVRLIGLCDERRLGSFPFLGIGLMSALRHSWGTVAEAQLLLKR